MPCIRVNTLICQQEGVRCKIDGKIDWETVSINLLTEVLQ